MPFNFVSNLFKAGHLAPSGRPLLNKNEHDIAIADGVGIYQSEYKLKNYQQGRLYLTSQRLIYVTDSPGKSCIYFDISSIQSIKFYTGFFKSSPKIIIKVDENQTTSKVDNLVITWVCPICSYSNDTTTSEKEMENFKISHTNLPVCGTCGVACTFTLLQKYFLQEFTSKQRKSVDLLSSEPEQCPECTFINHPSLQYCEMCGTKLDGLNRGSDGHERNVINGLNLTTETEFGSEIDLTIIKFSFRNGHDQTFFNSLEAAIKSLPETATTESIKKTGKFNTYKPFNGIHGLENQGDEAGNMESLLLNKSMQDLGQLMEKAKDLIVLSKKYQSILNSSNVAPTARNQNLEILNKSKESINKLDSIIKNNQMVKAIDNTHTIHALGLLKKGKSNKSNIMYPLVYIEELARNICDFIINENILDINNGIITSFEIYSLYNKRRQVNLITAEELFYAIDKFEALSINLKATKVLLSHTNDNDKNLFFYVISKSNEKESFSTKILNCVVSNPGISITQLQNSRFNVNFFILKTVLDSLVQQGKLTIDTTLKGNAYWPNKILENAVPYSQLEDRKSKLLLQTELNLRIEDISNDWMKNATFTTQSHTYDELKNIDFTNY